MRFSTDKNNNKGSGKSHSNRTGKEERFSLIRQYYVNAAMGLWSEKVKFIKNFFVRLAAVCIVFLKSCICLFKKPERFHFGLMRYVVFHDYKYC